MDFGDEREDALQREEFSDFTLVLKNGRKLKCHKVKLAEASPFFRTMLRQDCLETQNNQMKVTEYNPDTVETFLNYIYADLDLAKDQDNLIDNRCRSSAHIQWTMKIDKRKLTPELLKMCHNYEVKDLQDLCVRHLLNSIDDSNVVDIWMAAETIDNDKLREGALDYLGNQRNKLLDVPGLEESLESSHLAKSLVKFISHRILPSTSSDLITVKVECRRAGSRTYLDTRHIEAKLGDSVKVLRLLINDDMDKDCTFKFKAEPGSLGVWKSGDYTTSALEEHRTLAYYDLTDQSTVYCDCVKQEIHF